MERKTISTAAVLGIIAIVLGAFGAHTLKKILSVEQLTTFETGVKYQMYHALFLLFIGTSKSISEKAQKRILNLTIVGVTFFSGSIYLLATKDFLGFDIKPIGIITPIGGLLLIIAWVLLFIDFFNKKT